jgi:hypothetical protein
VSSLSIHALALETFVPMLRALSELLDKSAQHAAAKGFDPGILVRARLAPDMYPLSKQVQLACHQASDATARLARRDPVQYVDEPARLDELRAHIARVVDYVERAPVTAFDGAEDLAIEISPGRGSTFAMNGIQFLRDWAMPHFYFHVVTAYDILRHNGVPIGKQDYLSRAAVYMRRG